MLFLLCVEWNAEWPLIIFFKGYKGQVMVLEVYFSFGLPLVFLIISRESFISGQQLPLLLVIYRKG